MTATAEHAETVTVRHLIGGEWVGEPTDERRNPARPDEVVAAIPKGGEAEVDAAVGAAEAAFAAWRATPGPARGAILYRAAELLSARKEVVGRDLCREEGKTLTEATGEAGRAADILRYHAGAGSRALGENLPSSVPNTHLYSVKEPLGVVGLITPWNFPIAIPAWKLAPALVSGNTVVIKPASITPVSVQHLAECLVEAGLPDGVLNIVLGGGGTVGDAIVRDERVKAISFTGSTEVGFGVNDTAARRRARVQLELGGKNAMVVLDDADPAAAAKILTQGGFGLTGQACTATARVIATRAGHDRLVEALAAEAENWTPGDGQAEGTKMGPVVSESQLENDRSYLDIAREEGAEVARGGDSQDLFLQPAILTGVAPSMRVAQEEIFGPVISVLEVADLDEAVELANASPYGHTGGIITNDLSAAMHYAERVEVGTVKINRPTTGLDPGAPFGGMKDSSSNTFREQGSVATEFYTKLKTVYLGF